MDVLAKVKSFDINMGWCSSITKMSREEKKKKRKKKKAKMSRTNCKNKIAGVFW